MRTARPWTDTITAVAVDEPLGAALDRAARLGFRRRLNVVRSPDEILELIASTYAQYAFSDAQLARWTAQVEQWRIAQQVQEAAQESAIEASFGVAAFEQGSVDLGRRLVLGAIARLRAAKGRVT